MSSIDYSNILKNLKKQTSSKVFSVVNFSNQKKHDVDVSDVISFFKNYCETLHVKDLSQWEKAPVFSIGEITGSHIPIIGEFLFKFQLEDKPDSLENLELELYDRELVNTIIKIYQDVLKNLFFISSSASELICVVLESNIWKEGGTYNVKLRFQFPYCKTDKDFCNGTLRNKVIQKLRQSRVNQYFTESSPIGDWENHLEQVKDYYPLYGSTDNLKRPPLYFIGVFSQKGELGIESAFKYTTHQFITSEKCVVTEIDTLKDPDLEEYDLAILHLPIFLSLEFWAGIIQIKDEYNVGKTSLSSSVILSDDLDDFEAFNSEPTDFEICQDLIEMLNDDRFQKETFFLDIGKALYKSCEGEEEGLEEWKRWNSEKGNNFDEIFLNTKYETFENESITVKTIAWYAKQDNKGKYLEWHENWCKPKLMEALSLRHIMVAKSFYRVFWLDFMYSNRKWVEFRKNRLVVSTEDFHIRRTITDKFIPCFDKIRAELSEQKLKINKDIGKSSSREKVNDLEKLITDVGKLIDKLLTESYRTALVKSLKEYFIKENLNQVLNKNPNLLGCNNCVIELTDTNAYVRQGKPEDFITKKAGVSYRSDYSFKHPDVKALLKYFEQVFPEPSIRHHMKKDISAILYGRNSEKCFRMWIGNTNGSKSIYQKMIRIMFGDYYCDLPASFYSANQKGGSGPNPELAQTDGARVAFSAEPDTDISIKGPRIKSIAGGDAIFARSCNENGGSIETNFKPVLVLNLVPDMDLDEATILRFHMIPFEGRWVRKDEKFSVAKSHEEQVKEKTYNLDDRFEENLPKLATALLWLAVNYYKIYREEGLLPPKYIKDWMTDFWKKHDPHLSFITEMLENPKIKVDCDSCKEDDKEVCEECKGTGKKEIIDTSKYITATDVYPVYKRWFRETYPHVQVMAKPKMIDVLSTPDKLKKQKDRRWYGVILRRQAPPEISEF